MRKNIVAINNVLSKTNKDNFGRKKLMRKNIVAINNVL
jgi:hypothetical protein